VKQHLYVELEDDLPPHRHNGIMHAIKFIPGVEVVCVLESISRETLDEWLMPPLPADLVKPKRQRKGKAA